jgi:hypothetical protein
VEYNFGLVSGRGRLCLLQNSPGILSSEDNR